MGSPERFTVTVIVKQLSVAVLWIILVLMVSVPVWPAESPDYSLAVNRLVSINDYGVTTVTDSFNVTAKSTVPVESLLVAFPRKFEKDLRYLQARDAKGMTLQVDKDVEPSPDLYWVRIKFPRGIVSGEKYVFTTSMIFTSLVKMIEGGFELEFSMPILKADSQFANVTISVPFGSDFKLPRESPFRRFTFQQKPALYVYHSPWHANAPWNFTVAYTSVNQYIVYFRSASREVTLEPSGSLSVRDAYRLDNQGISLTALSIRLPEGARNVMLYDAVGPIWIQPRDTSDVSVAPRYIGGVKYNQSFTFELRYTLPSERFVKEIAWWGKYNFTIDVISNPRFWIIEKLNFTTRMPFGVQVEKATREPVSLKETPYQLSGHYTINDVTFLGDLKLSMLYRYPPLSAGLKELLWIGVAELAVIVLGATLMLRRVPQPVVTVPVDKIRLFVDLSDERLALRSEVDRLEAEVLRGALNKHEFRRRQKTIELRLNEASKAIETTKIDVKATGARYRELMTKMEQAEAVIETSKASQAQMRDQYRAGRISKETYEALASDLRKRAEKARDTLESSLIALREELM